MNEIITGDCLDVMRTFPDNHFSGIVCDPPYGLGFLGKHWDAGLPHDAIWKEALRIVKPGAHLLAFGGTRTYHRLTCAIEDAGWEIRDSILYWGYGSGFPKSHNHFGIGGYGTALKPAYEPIVMCMKPLEGTFAQNAEKWGQAGINIDGCRVNSKANSFIDSRTKKNKTVFSPLNPKNYDGTKGRWPSNLILDEESAQLLDQQSGFSKSPGKTYRGASRFFFIARNDRIDACQLQKELLLPGKKTESANNSLSTDMFGSEPMGLFLLDTISIIKMETRSIMSFPILNVWKQTLIGTCMLECEKIIEPSMVSNIEAVSFAENGCVLIYFQNEVTEPIRAIVKNVPENDWLNGEKVIGNTGTNTIGKGVDKQGMRTTRNISEKTETESMPKEGQDILKRFFYCAKASPRERNEGLEDRDAIQTTDGCIRSNPESARQYQANSAPRKNPHPTIKPLSLMRYLITLIAPPKDALILDPFAGSGSTIVAAQELGIKAIGIEKEPEYAEIARARVAHTAQKVQKVAEQTDLFNDR